MYNPFDEPIIICLRCTDKFKRGDLCFYEINGNGDYVITSIDYSGSRCSYISRKAFNNNFISIDDHIVLKLCKEFSRRTIFLKPKMKSKIKKFTFDFEHFYEKDLIRIQSEVLIYLVKIQDEELLLQFSTDIIYTLNTLIELYQQRDDIDYGLEITKASKVFKEINAYCLPLQDEANEQSTNIKNEKLKSIMDKHNLNMKSTLQKIKELNEL